MPISNNSNIIFQNEPNIIDVSRYVTCSVWFSTDLKFCFPCAIKSNCFSTADLICGCTRSGSIAKYPCTKTIPNVVGIRRLPDPTYKL